MTTDPGPAPAKPSVVDQAASVLGEKHGFMDSRYYHDAQLLAAAGLLADPAALLHRLADLTDAAGKLRSTEWLRTCAHLPPEEWPPAPAYKGPVVHLDDPRPDFAALTSAQLRDLRLRIVTELRQRRGLAEPAREADRG